MMASPHVLLGLRSPDVGRCLSVWVRARGYEVDVAEDGESALTLLRARPFAASFLDAGMEEAEGRTVWRVVHRIVGRRLVLMAWERRNDLWFEALRAGVAAVLPLPPEESMVRAALVAATGRASADEGPRDG